MSSLPNEILEDVLQPLDRGTLDDVQFTDGRFLQLILERMSGVCLRQVHYATFAVANENMEESFYGICIDGRTNGYEASNTHKDAALLFSEFVQALRSSRVASLYLLRLVFTPELAALVLQAPILADDLSLVESSCAELTSTEFRKVLLHFSPTSLDFNNSHLRPCQVTNAFLRALNKNHVLRAVFPRKVPVDGGSFCVTDDAVVDFCMQPDAQVGQEGAELAVFHGSFTKGLFKRLVEASSVSKRTQMLRIFMAPCSVEDEDLRDFAQHFSFSVHDGTVYQVRVYDFPGEKHGEDAAMHLQIVLHSENNGLGMMRGLRPNSDL